MSKNSFELLNDNYVLHESWARFQESPDFYLMTEYLEQRVKTLETQIKHKSKEHNLDGGISLLTLFNRKDEAESLLKKFEYHKRELKRLNDQAQKE